METALTIKVVGDYHVETRATDNCRNCGNADFGDVLIEGICGRCLLAAYKDKARLDWLETQSCWIGIGGEFEVTPSFCCGGAYRDTVRSVCDKNIAEK